MDEHKPKTKAFIITFIAVLLLLILGYYFYTKKTTVVETKAGTPTSFSKIFKSLFPTNKQKGVDVLNPDGTTADKNGNIFTKLFGGRDIGNRDGNGGTNNDTNGNNNGGIVFGQPQCSDGKDNDGDSFKDQNDPGCHIDYIASNIKSYKKDWNDENRDRNSKSECSDGKDNDDDKLSDINDPGCHIDYNAANQASYRSYINDESRTSNSTTMCSDGIDNNLDGKIDINDPSCHTDFNANNGSSYNRDINDEGREGGNRDGDSGDGKGSTQCSDGKDNDTDTYIDANDASCHSDFDATNPNSYDKNINDESRFEYENPIPECSDGKDNDGDKTIDINDPSCHTDFNIKNKASYNKNINDEGRTKDTNDDDNDGGGNTPACSDGEDNDGDSFIDTNDSSCHSDFDASNTLSYEPLINDEYRSLGPTYKPQCSDGKDNDGDKLSDALDPSCHYDYDANNSASYLKLDNDESRKKDDAPACSDGIDNDLDGVIDINDAGCHTDYDVKNGASYDPNLNSESQGIFIGSTIECSDGKDNDSDNLVDEKDPGCHSDFNASNPNTYTPRGNTESASKINSPQCNDGLDNDGDKLIDIFDPSCHTNFNANDATTYSARINDESLKKVTIPQCSDKIDNDNDGFIDIKDPSCHTDNDPANRNSYDSKIDDESFNLCPIDDPLVYTADEKLRLDDLTRQFYKMAGEIKTDGDIQVERDIALTYNDLVTTSKKLINQCYTEVASASYTGPKARRYNPYWLEKEIAINLSLVKFNSTGYGLNGTYINSTPNKDKSWINSDANIPRDKIWLTNARNGYIMPSTYSNFRVLIDRNFSWTNNIEPKSGENLLERMLNIW